MFKDTCTAGKMLRSNHGIWAPLSPASWEARVTNDLWKKEEIYLCQHSFIKKKRPEKNFICLSWLSSDFWLRQHGPFYFYRILVSGWYWAMYSLNPSVKLLTHSWPKIEFYLFAIAYLPTVFPPTQLFFCLSRILFFFFATSFSGWNTKTSFFLTRNPQDH